MRFEGYAVGPSDLSRSSTLEYLSVPSNKYFIPFNSVLIFCLSLSFNLHQIMPRKVRETFLFVFTSVFIFFTFSLYLSRNTTTIVNIIPLKQILTTHSSSNSAINVNRYLTANSAIQEDQHEQHVIRQVITSPPPSSLYPFIKPDSILFPDWEILNVINDNGNENHHLLLSDSGNKFLCLFDKSLTSPEIYAGILPFSNQSMFKCIFPNRLRRFLPYFSPILIDNSSPETVLESQSMLSESSNKEIMLRWKFLVYESLSTDTDVILFVKGVNNRQGINRSPSEFRCIFSNNNNNFVITEVISSYQEVFRCIKPEINATLFRDNDQIKVSLGIRGGERVVPSVAYYTLPAPSLTGDNKKFLLCACTMVHNVAKFLREWVYYHSKIGVDKFILYDNGSDDNLDEVISKLREENYQVEKILWPWPKTQEAGFSHSATYANATCTWMMYVDVDEFIFSPSWLHPSSSSPMSIRSLLPSSSSHHNNQRRVGQISIKCYEFGPSNQRSNPVEGVTQGYSCRRKIDSRHKSIVLLDGINTSLLNVIHHFELKQGYRNKKLSLDEMVINHYKYQAWSEFRLKFRRRVSAYVIDWKEGLNPNSKDRAPGLGFEPVEPKGWVHRFCDVHDNRLKMVTKEWFGSSTGRMAWQLNQTN
ncbi:glycosyltransferase family 92 protein RCOM_0530710-like [Papaver somniferum]|nr:glycosyltransferase family 92 protein RCOM_0530710-like [Papaver somniferum]